LHLLAEWAGKDHRGEQQFVMRAEVASALTNFEWPATRDRPKPPRTPATPTNGVAPTEDEFATDTGEPPARVKSTVNRIIRDTAMIRTLKELHRNTCQHCGKRLRIRKGVYYSEGHHLRPLGDPHSGPDERSNILVLCPDCHVRLDLAAVALKADTLRKHPRHLVAAEHIAYHNALVRKRAHA
jgi:putative restriction endonuclease